MSECYNISFTAIALNEKDNDKLKELKERCKSDGKVFSLEPLYPIPEHLKCFDSNGIVNEISPEVHNDEITERMTKERWCHINWGAYSDAQDSRVITDRENKYVVEFKLPGFPEHWLMMISKKYPTLKFYIKFWDNISSEHLTEVENGGIINHGYILEVASPKELKSNYVCDYEEFSSVIPKDNKGRNLPLTLIKIDDTTVLSKIEFRIMQTNFSNYIDQYFYGNLVRVSVEKVFDDKNIVALENSEIRDNEWVLEYSYVLQSKTIDKIVKKCLSLLEEIQKPIEDIKAKIKKLLIEFGTDTNVFKEFNHSNFWRKINRSETGYNHFFRIESFFNYYQLL